MTNESLARAERSGEALSGKQELAAVKRSLQEQRRATTLLNAELQRQIEAREALEAQLIEANAEIAASWDRRKEMTRVITDREAKLADAIAENARALTEAETDKERALAEVQAEKAREISGLRSELKASHERRKEMAQVIANRDSKITQLKERQKEMARVIANRDAKIQKLRAELQDRFDELAALQREIVRSSLSGQAKRLVRPLSRLLR